MSNEIQKVTVKALFTKDDAVFMLKSPDGKWELPGGKIDFGELPKDTLKRELKEELGVDKFKIGPVINVFDIKVKYKTTNYQFIVIVLKCEADLSKIKMSDEHIESKLIKLDQIKKYKMYKGYLESIKKYFKR